MVQPASTLTPIGVMNAVERDSSGNFSSVDMESIEIQRIARQCHCLIKLTDSPNESTTQVLSRRVSG